VSLAPSVAVTMPAAGTITPNSVASGARHPSALTNSGSTATGSVLPFRALHGLHAARRLLGSSVPPWDHGQM